MLKKFPEYVKKFPKLFYPWNIYAGHLHKNNKKHAQSEPQYTKQCNNMHKHNKNLTSMKHFQTWSRSGQKNSWLIHGQFMPIHVYTRSRSGPNLEFVDLWDFCAKLNGYIFIEFTLIITKNASNIRWFHKKHYICIAHWWGMQYPLTPITP